MLDVYILGYKHSKLTEKQIKVRISGFTFADGPFKGEGGPASDILGKFCTQRDGGLTLQKKNGRVCKKTTRPFSEAGGGGGKIYGQNTAEQIKKI
jgi:hypothetical protein